MPWVGYRLNRSSPAGYPTRPLWIGVRTPREARIDRFRELALVCARAANEKKAEDILVLDIGRILPIADYFVIASGKSRKQVQAIADEITQKMKAAGARRIGMEGYEEGSWICVDYGDVIVHLFHEDVRSFYELETLWADAPRVDWAHAEAAKAKGA